MLSQSLDIQVVVDILQYALRAGVVGIVVSVANVVQETYRLSRVLTLDPIQDGMVAVSHKTKRPHFQEVRKAVAFM